MKNFNLYSQKNCKFCNTPFFILKSRERQSKLGGSFCSYQCLGFSKFQKKRYQHKFGYTILPMIINGKVNRVYEHKAVMEAWLGRKLRKNEIVHHKDHNKSNNLISNLELMKNSDHVRFHQKIYGEIPCSVNGCKRMAEKKNMCDSHYSRQWKLKKYQELGGEV